MARGEKPAMSYIINATPASSGRRGCNRLSPAGGEEGNKISTCCIRFAIKSEPSLECGFKTNQIMVHNTSALKSDGEALKMEGRNKRDIMEEAGGAE